MLVVVDHLDDRSVVGAALRSAGFEVLEAPTGAEAMALVEEWRPALVIVDVAIWTRDRGALGTRLRSERIPLILTTASQLEGEVRELSEKSGAALLLHKPLDQDQVLAAVKDALERRPVLAQGEARLSDLDQDRLALLEKLLLLDELSAERHKLVAALLDAQVLERERIASELHDDALQALAAVMMRLSALGKRLTDSNDLEMVARLVQTVASAIERLRGLLSRLYPPEPSTEPLARTIAAYLDRIAQDNQVEVSLRSQMLAEPDPAAKSLLWLTAREILTNACRHACASHLEVVLSECHEGYRVTVRDDGRGFTPADAMRVRPGHIGLSTASARLQTHGGALRVSSRPDCGATIQIEVPRSPAQLQ